MEQQKQLHAKAYAPWTEEEDKRLTSYYTQGFSTEEIAKRMDRNEGGIVSRIKKLELERLNATAYQISSKQISGLPKTIQKTLELLTAGLNPSQIEVKRKLSGSTIYDHIAELIEKGALNVSDFVSQSAYNRITKAIEEVPSKKLSEIKLLCGDAISYEDIKMVLADERLKKNEANQYHIVRNLQYTKSSKYFLTSNCRVVLSKSGYYLELNKGFIKLADITNGFRCDEGNIFIKKPKNELGFRVFHDMEEDIHLIGYIREENDTIVFTSPDNKKKVIKEE